MTDEVGDPSGEPAEGETDPQYQESDITRLTDFTGVDYALIKINNPQDELDGTGTDADGNDEYLPISLQYRPYTADGSSVRQVSLAGDPADGSTWYDHGTESGVAMENRSYYGKSTSCTNESSLDLVLDTKAALPEGAKLLLVIEADHPMVFSEIEPSADVILMSWAGDSGPTGAGFQIPDNTYAKILTGAVEPSALLQFQMPADMDTVEDSLEDVPRDLDVYVDSEGNAYDFCFGLNWSGVISDARTAEYGVPALTQCETEVIPG